MQLTSIEHTAERAIVFHFSDGTQMSFSGYRAVLDASRNSDRALHDPDSLERWTLIDEYLEGKR